MIYSAEEEALRRATFKSNQGRTPRTCEELGVCQGRDIPCLLCDRAGVQQWPQEPDTLTPMEQIFSWAVAAVAAGVSVFVIVGGASYTYFRWIAP